MTDNKILAEVFNKDIIANGINTPIEKVEQVVSYPYFNTISFIFLHIE